MATNFPGFSRLGGDTYDYTRSGSKKSESAPELLFKMCKKIAQLTKVVYVLNTRNDDLEMQCKSADEATEEKVSSATADLKRTVSQLKAELKKKIDLNDRVKGLEETLMLRDQELRKLLEEIATVRKRQEERERDLSCAYRLELRQATEAQQVAERRLAEVLAGQEDSQRLPSNRRRSTEYQGTLLQKEKSVEHEAKEEKRLILDEEESEEEPERRKRGGADETRRRVREQEVAEFRRLVEQLQKDLKEKTERWEAVAKEERSKLEAQLERAKTAKEDAEKLLAQQLQAES